MKILLSADIHGNHDAYRWLSQTAKELSASLVLAGDLLGCPEGFATPEEAQRADAERIFSILMDGGVRVFYVWGNDDFVEISPPSERIQFLHGRRVECGRWNLLGYQHSPPFVGGPHERSEEEISVELATLEPLADTKTIFVTHSPGYGVLDLGILDRHAGSPAILKFVQDNDVRVHVHGHVHRSFGSDGRHFNVAASAKCQAVLLDVESLQSVVLHGPKWAV